MNISILESTQITGSEKDNNTDLLKWALRSMPITEEHAIKLNSYENCNEFQELLNGINNDLFNLFAHHILGSYYWTDDEWKKRNLLLKEIDYGFFTDFRENARWSILSRNDMAFELMKKNEKPPMRTKSVLWKACVPAKLSNTTRSKRVNDINRFSGVMLLDTRHKTILVWTTSLDKLRNYQ